jgi:uncharacterized protein (DUF1501 family)
MNHTRKARREFLRRLCCVAAGGGAAALIPQLRMLGTALAASSSTAAFGDYRALVCVYLQGGNDSWNLLVPFDAARFNVYTASRSGTYDAVTNNIGLGLTLPTGAQVAAQKVIDGNDASSTTNQYFLHPNLPEMTALFNQQKLAFLVNVGTLVKPITMADYNASAANHPAQLFSHSDQTAQWNQAASVATGRPGWGGLCAEKLTALGANLSSSPTIPLAISISGSNRFEIGANSVPYQMSPNGLAALSGVCNPTCSGGANSNGARDAALNNLLAETYASDFAGEYNKVFANARALYATLGTDLPPLSSTYVPANTWPNTNNNALAAQLKSVATMINLSKSKGYASRQIYFVQLGGFDLHSGFYSGNTGHAALLTQVSQALDAFYAAMVSFGLQDQVTLFTASDFARTLQSNGSGSDHAWGSVQMVLGGAVNGGKLYSDGGGPIAGFPNQALNAPNNFARGQIIPGIGVEQYAATLARWMGVTSPTDLGGMFPNLAHFSSSNLGFVS